MRGMDRPAFDAPANEWLVYGDALQVANDPRGELVGLVHGNAGAGVIAAYVRRHGKALFGIDPGDTFECDWNYCLLRGVTVRLRAGQADPLASLLALDLARELREVTLVGVGTVDLAPAMAILREHAPPTCKAFRFVDEKAQKSSMLVSRDFDPDPNLVTFGSFEPFLATAEQLAIVTADSHQLDFGDFEASNLTSFSLRSLRLAGWEDLEGIGETLSGAQFANLTSFELRLVEQFNANIPDERNAYVEQYADSDRRDEVEEGDSEGVNWGDLSRLFATLARCPLERLALTSFVSSRSLVSALRSHVWPDSLTTLDLSDSRIDDEDATLLSGSRPGGVTHLVLERTQVTDEGAARLRAGGYTVDHSTSSDAPSFRYVVGSE